MRHGCRLITEELLELHMALLAQWPELKRVAVALYDEHTGKLHTFVKSSPYIKELDQYSVELEQVETLVELSSSGSGRVIQDLQELEEDASFYAQELMKHFKSSYTEPLYIADQLLGFVFFNASEKNYFSKGLIGQLKVNVGIIESLIVAEVLPLKFLLGLVDTTREIVHIRDNETGHHLMRVSSYYEVMAIELAEEFGFTDEEIQYMWYYAPLHDLGKIAIPDSILLKPGRLTVEEIEIMKTHVSEGLRILEMISKNFQFQRLSHFDLLTDMVGDHHECWDGSGYPKGLVGDGISPAGRMMAVADVFDALVMDRVYRAGVPINDVFEYIQSKSGSLFDPKCVDAFVKNRDVVEKIAREFRDAPEGRQREQAKLTVTKQRKAIEFKG